MNDCRTSIRVSVWSAAAALIACCPAYAATSRPAFSLAMADSLALGAMANQPAPSTEQSVPTSADAQSEDQAPGTGRDIPVFGAKGSEWWSVSASGMADDDDNRDYSVRLGYHHFIAEDFEINAAITGWYHDQPNENEYSGSFDLGFRYHFLCDEQNKDWTVYADVGIGVMLSSGEVPEGGTDFNFTPRVGLGMTMRLPDQFGGAAGGRLDLGAGWQHYSNASISGSDDNPARDSFQFRAGVMFPF